MEWFISKLTPGDIFLLVGIILSAALFVYAMKPRLDAHDTKFGELEEWKKEYAREAKEHSIKDDSLHREQDTLSRERDGAINKMAIAMASLATTLADSVRRLDRVEDRMDAKERRMMSPISSKHNE